MQIVKQGKITVFKCGKKNETKPTKKAVKKEENKTQEVNNESKE